jgi:predicted adenylyl cyclase CyaB
MNFEVEYKFSPENIEPIKEYLKDAKFLKKADGEDIYFDDSKATLFRKGIFVRLRDKKRLDFKFNFKDDLSHTGCNETSFSLPLDSNKKEAFNKLLALLQMQPVENLTFESFLEINDLKEFVPIKKHRITYEKDSLRFCLDHVDDLGFFLEVDKTTEDEEEIPKIKSQMENLKHRFNLKLLNTGYVELYLRKHNFDLYKQGLYLLTEDR